jgi:hypothetical protein
MSDNRNPCDGCAFTEGAVANCEPQNNLRSQLALLGGVPFYSHHLTSGEEVDLDDFKPLTPELMRSLGVQVCAGWRREVKELASTGYFIDNREAKRIYAIAGLGLLNQFLEAEQDSPEKQDASSKLRNVILALNKERGFEEVKE